MKEPNRLIFVLVELLRYCGNSSKPGCNCGKCKAWRAAEGVIDKYKETKI